MKYQCSACGDIIQSTFEDRFELCMCESIFVDGSYDRDGTQVLSRYGYLKDGADIIPVEEH